MTPSRTICFGFLALIVVGAGLLCLPISLTAGNWGNPLTGLFISTSAVCVTGLSVVDVGKFYTHFGQAVILLLFQVGGLGYMTATTFLVLLIGGKFSLREKITLQQSLDLPGLRGATVLVRSIIVTTLLLEIGGSLLLLPAFLDEYGWGQSLWLAVFHSVSAFNNAGFSLFGNNLMDYVQSPLVNGTISGLVIFGGIGYQVILEAYLWLRSRLSTKSNDPILFLSLNFKVVTTTTAFLLLVGTIALLVTELMTPQLAVLPWTNKLWAAWFHAVSARTAGFNTIDLAQMTQTGLFVIIVLMFIGASPGGTGGGVKTTTVRILSCCTGSALYGQDEVFLYQRQVPIPLIFKAVGVVIGSLSVVIGATAFLSMSDRTFDLMQLLFEATSAFGTVGLSVGITANLSPWGQLILIATMYIGRVGILLLMAAMGGGSRPSLLKFPEEYLLVG